AGPHLPHLHSAPRCLIRHLALVVRDDHSIHDAYAHATVVRSRRQPSHARRLRVIPHLARLPAEDVLHAMTAGRHANLEVGFAAVERLARGIHFEVLTITAPELRRL